MRRMKGSERHNAGDWVLGKGNLQRYAGDVVGFRYFGGDEQEEGFHNQRQVPSFPILGHAPIIWMFRNTTDVDANAWTITEVGAGTQLALQDEMGGIAKAITGAVDDNYQRYFSLSECAQISAEGVITLHTKVRILEPIQCDAFIGLCERGVDPIAGRQNAVGFYLSDGSALIRVESNSGGSSEQESSGVSAVADTWVELTINIVCNPDEGTQNINFFIDHVFIAAHVTNIPSAAMAFCFAIQNGEGSANELSLGTTYLIKDIA